MTTKYALFTLAGALALALGMAPGAAAQNATIGAEAKPLAIEEWVKGEPVDVTDGDKLYVVEFWATWCPPCRDSIPHLTELQDTFEDDVVFIGVSNEDVATVESFVQEMGDKMDYHVAVDRNGATSQRYMEAFGQGGIPTAFVVDRNGTVAWVGHPMNDLEATLSELVEMGSDGADGESADTEEPELGMKAPELSIAEWVKGEPVDVTTGDNVKVVEFWATWCPPCRDSIPHLTELQKKYKDQGVEIIGVSDEDVATVKPFVEDMGDDMAYHVAVDDNRETFAAYMDAFGQSGIPTAFIVDQDNRIVWVGHPMMDLDGTIDAVLEGTYDIEEAKAEQKREQEAQAKQQEAMETIDTFMTMVADEGADPAETVALGQEVFDSLRDQPQILIQIAAAILDEEAASAEVKELAGNMADAAMEQAEEGDPIMLAMNAFVLHLQGQATAAQEAKTKALEAVAGSPMEGQIEQFLNEQIPSGEEGS